MRTTDNGVTPRPGPAYRLPEDGPRPDLPLYERLIGDGIATADAQGNAVDHLTARRLAIWLAARSKLPSSSELYTKDPLPIKGVVDLDGPGDLKATIPMQQRVCGAPVITQLMGGTPEEQPRRYREGSPIEMLPLGVRVDFFAGRMFATQAPAYEEAARRAGDVVHTVVSGQATHFVFIDPESAVWPQVAGSTRALLGLQ